MAGSLIGSLRVTLGIDTAAFQDGLAAAQKRMAAATAKIQAAGDKMIGIGATLSAGITLPFTALVKAAVPAAVESQQALAQVEAALKSMGNASGRNVEQLQKQAGALQALSNFDDDDILKSVTANLLTFGNVSGAVFDRAQLAAVNLSARLGQDLQSSAIQLGKALNDPIKGVTALQRVGVSFTAQQKDQIKAMVASGNAAGAQSLILGELEKQFGGAAKAQRDATPDAAMQEQWRTFQENIGGLALKILPSLNSALEGILKSFNNLSPGMQTVIAASAAAAAAAGPLLTVFGGLLRVVAPLVGAFAVEGGFAVGLAGLAPILIPLAAAVAGVVVAYQNWDKIGPWIDGVVQRTSQAAADINAKLATVQDAANRFDQRMGVPSQTDFIDGAQNAILGAVAKIDAGLKWLQNGANAFDAAFMQMSRNAVGSAKALYEGVKVWLVDNLSAIWSRLEKMTQAAGDYFHTLWDRVVGHSYIPDMVDAIGQHMGRLQGNMVDAAGEATETTAGKFATMAEGVAGSVQALFNDIKSKDWGGLLGGILKIAGGFGAFGSSGPTRADPFAGIGDIAIPSSGSSDVSLPRFATGGSFQVRGMRGIDNNVLSLNQRPIARVSHGETVGVGRGGSAPAVVQLVVDEGSLFRPTVAGISGEVSVETVGRNNLTQARAQSRRIR